MPKTEYNMVFWNETDQHIRYKSSTTFEGNYKYEYVGMCTRAEFDLLLEVLFEVYDYKHISLDNFQRVFGDIRTFCDIIKKIVDENYD